MKKLIILLLITTGLFAQSESGGYYIPSKWKLSGTTISPSLSTWSVGLPITTATSLALGGATISTHALAVTGTSLFGGNIYLPNGTAALPSLSFSGDTNTGLYSVGADQLGIAVNGANMVTVTTTGMGIGTTGPLTKLHVSGASATNVDVLTLENTDITSNTTRALSLNFVGRDTGGNQKTVSAIRSVVDQINANDGYLSIHTRNANTLIEQIRINKSGDLDVFNGVLRVAGTGNTTIAGNVGIGQTTFLRSAKLGVTGMIMSSDTLWVGNNVTYSYITPGGALVQSSDESLKNNITLFQPNLANFSKIKPRKYNFKEENFYKAFDEKSVPDSVEKKVDNPNFGKVQIVSVDGKDVEQKEDSLVTVKVDNSEEKLKARIKFRDENLTEAKEKSQLAYTGFLANEFNPMMLNKQSKELNTNEVIAVMWLKIQELEEVNVKQNTTIANLEARIKVLESK